MFDRSLVVQEDPTIEDTIMGNAWGPKDPTPTLPNNSINLRFDDHRYYKRDNGIEQSRAEFVSAACYDNRGGNGSG